MWATITICLASYISAYVHLPCVTHLTVYGGNWSAGVIGASGARLRVQPLGETGGAMGD